MTPSNALFLLIDYSLRGAVTEQDRLAIYDAVESAGVPLAEKLEDGEGAKIGLIVLKAVVASSSIRTADKAQLEFEDAVKEVRR